jgi:non-specific serine/threonine protein kinase
MALTPGTRLGSYEILALLGVGGMGEVYRARGGGLHRDVAIKVLPAELARDAERLARFEREVRAASALDHPHICVVHQVGEQEGQPFLVMQLLEGRTLKQLLERPLPVDQVVELGIQIADALDAAHARGIVHRDLKPANLFVTDRGQAKILDFGLAKLVPGLPSGAPAVAASQLPTVVGADLTGSAAVLGTPAYMSPEQARGETLDARTDLFSLGAVLYEMLTGRQAFGGSSLAVVFHGILVKDPVAELPALPEVPEQLRAVLAKALAKDRELRYPSAAELRADLERLRSELAPSRSAPSAHRPARAPRRRVARFAAGALVAALAALVALYSVSRGRSDGPIDSVAVLPFANTSGDPQAEYLSDGITDILINSLSRLRRLRVVPRSTVFRYKHRSADPQEVGRALEVHAVVAGRVDQRGDTIVVGAELIDVSRNSQLWGELYERRAADLLEIQSEIAREISAGLRLRLSADEATRLVEVRTRNVEAYHLYLKGLYHRQKTTESGFGESVDSFRRAVALDPTYPQAYAGLSDSYGSLAYLGLARPSEVWPQAKAAALTALRLDETLAEAHAALGHALLRYDWDPAAARRAFDRAVELDPSYAIVHHWYAHYWTTMGQRERALAASRRAVELQPLDLMLNAHLLFFESGPQLEEQRLEQIRKVREIEPEFWAAATVLGASLLGRGQFDAALDELRKGADASGRMPLALLYLGTGYAAAGRRPEAEAVIAELERRPYSPSIFVAWIRAELGDKEAGLESLERAYRERDSFWTDSTRGWPADWQADSRFQDLMRRVGLPH